MLNHGSLLSFVWFLEARARERGLVLDEGGVFADAVLNSVIDRRALQSGDRV